MNPYLEIIRPHNCLMAGFAVLVGALVASGSPFSSAAFLGFTIAFLISGAGFVINDYYDFDVDTVNRPSRVLPSGRMSIKESYRYAMVLFCIGITLCAFINVYALVLAAFNSFLLYLYAWKIKKGGGIGKNLAVSYLAASPLILGGIVAGFMEPTLLLALLAGLANTSREIIKDIEDFEGDRLFATTLPMKIGFEKSAILARLFILAAILLSPLPYHFEYLGKYYLLFVFPANVLFFASFVFLRNVSVQSAKKTQRFIKVGMFLALVAFLAGIYN